MQINKLKDLVQSDAVAIARKMKIRQEPLQIKSALLLRLYK